MKALSVAVFVGMLALACLSENAQAQMQENNPEACQALLCLYGRLMHTGKNNVTGGKQPACQPATHKFFSILKFTPFYNPVRTAQARTRFLEECSGAQVNTLWVTEVISLYGTVMFDPPW